MDTSNNTVGPILVIHRCCAGARARERLGRQTHRLTTGVGDTLAGADMGHFGGTFWAEFGAADRGARAVDLHTLRGYFTSSVPQTRSGDLSPAGGWDQMRMPRSVRVANSTGTSISDARRKRVRRNQLAEFHLVRLSSD